MTVGNAGRRTNSRFAATQSATALTPRAPRKRPSQLRSHHTVEVIVEAATRVFDKMGTRATTNQVAELAGVSIGSLYQYFPNKLALITELHERHQTLVAKSILGALDASESLHMDDTVQAVVAGILSVHRERPGLQRVLHAQLPQLSQRDDPNPVKRALAERVGRWLQSHLPEADRDTLSLAVPTVLTLCEGLVHDAVLRPRSDVSDQAVAANIARVLCGYVDRLALVR